VNPRALSVVPCFGAALVLGILGCAAGGNGARGTEDAGTEVASPEKDATTPEAAATAAETAPDRAPEEAVSTPDAAVEAAPPDGAPGETPDAGKPEAKPDAGLADAPRDAAVEVASSGGCAGSAFALCEDFEGGALDGKLWKATQNKGTATLDTTRAARGSKTSLHVHVEPGSDTTVGIVESRTFPALAHKLYARAFIYIPGATSTMLFTGDRHSRLIYALGASPYGEYALGIWNGGLIQNHYSKTDDSVDTKMLPPFDQWFCLEYELDAAAGNVRAYLNEVEIVALRHDGWPATQVASLLFGVDRFGSFAVAEDLWFDELVVDAARIGCAR
jgi:hypothetical protein